MGRLAITPGASPMAVDRERGRGDVGRSPGREDAGGQMGRSRSEGGERLTRKRRREGGEVEDDWEKGKCGKCGEILWVIVKHKEVQTEMGRRGCCTMRKVEQERGVRRSGKRPDIGDN